MRKAAEGFVEDGRMTKTSPVVMETIVTPAISHHLFLFQI